MEAESVRQLMKTTMIAPGNSGLLLRWHQVTGLEKFPDRGFSEMQFCHKPKHRRTVSSIYIVSSASNSAKNP